jgi:hypothetical protein
MSDRRFRKEKPTLPEGYQYGELSRQIEQAQKALADPGWPRVRECGHCGGYIYLGPAGIRHLGACVRAEPDEPTSDTPWGV